MRRCSKVTALDGDGTELDGYGTGLDTNGTGLGRMAQEVYRDWSGLHVIGLY